MVSYPYVITVAGLTIYTIYAYIRQSQIIAIHCIYTICLIIYNSKITQRDKKFAHLHPPLIPQQHPDKQKQNLCKICNRIKPSRYYHCRRCNICIYQMDHHCDWLNCCVGQFNCKVYLHILVNLLGVGLGSFRQILGSGSWLDGGKIFRFIVTGFLVWQVIRMGVGVIEMIESNQTLVQTYKKVKGPKKTKMQKLVEIFGTPLSINWLIPTYTDSKNSDPFEQVQPISKKAAEQLKQLTYADEYLYGESQQDQFTKQAELIQKSE